MMLMMILFVIMTFFFAAICQDRCSSKFQNLLDKHAKSFNFLEKIEKKRAIFWLRVRGALAT
jgi:hypothetical protein